MLGSWRLEPKTISLKRSQARPDWPAISPRHSGKLTSEPNPILSSPASWRKAALVSFYHNRQLTSIDNHVVKRANRDTLYSTAVFDLDAGPVTITLPGRGQSLHDDDHDRRGSLRVHGRLWAREPHAHEG